MAVSLFAIALAGCATDTPPPPAPPPPPPPAPAGPPVALATEISDAAAVYVDYIRSAKAIGADFADGQSVQTRLQAGETYEPKQLARGAIAYAAIVAMQEPSFRSALRAYAANDSARTDMVQKLIADPSYADALPSVDMAARRVILALSSDGQSVYKAGTQVKQAAYDIQHQNWSKEFIPGRDERLALAKQNSVTLKSVQSDESARLLAAALTGDGLVTGATTGSSSQSYVVGGAGVTTTAMQGAAPQAMQATQPLPATAQAVDASAAAPIGSASDFNRPDLFNQPYSPTVTRALAVAAIAILGEGGENRADTLNQMISENDGSACLGMSKLNLYQCLSVAKPYYEDVFCLGQHVLMDTGQCLGKMSSNALSFDPVRTIGVNSDGSIAHADAVPYLQPDAPAAKCRKGRKCKAASTGDTETATRTSGRKHRRG
ncbi:MAG: hypothetical protein ACXU8U_04755 [Asticcacaulis sp.]